MRHCDGTDPNLVDLYGNPCSCGLTFDDVDHLVLYPHARITTQEEKQLIIKQMCLSADLDWFNNGFPQQHSG